MLALKSHTCAGSMGSGADVARTRRLLRGRSLFRAARLIDYLAEDGLDGAGVERAGIVLPHTGQDFEFAAGIADRQPGVAFERQDLGRKFRAAIQQAKQVAIEIVYLRTASSEVIVRLHGSLRKNKNRKT